MERTEKIQNFLNKIISIYGDRIGKEIIQAIEKELPVCFRINTLKANEVDVLKELDNLGFNIQRGKLSNSFYLKDSINNLSLSKTRVFDDGEIYIQSFSSMIPSFVLNPLPGEKILDLCAAPGSKTTHIAALANNQANIVAVENNLNRFNALKRNCQLQGVKNIEFIKMSAQELFSKRPQYLNYFDKVLCDVPCSNEGLLRNINSQDFLYWNLKNVKNLSMLQKKLISTGIRMLKKGGTLIYSTCTYSVEENEQVIDWAINKFTDIKLGDLPIESVPIFSGIINWKGKTFDNSIKKSSRILPGDLYEGFFIVKLEKKQV